MRAAILSNAIAAAGHALVATVDDRTVRDNLLSFGRAYLGLASLVVLRHDIRVHRHRWVAIPRIWWRETAVMPATDDYRRMHDEENAEFSAYLHSLEPAEFDKASLCDGWRVRDVVGHILYGNELNLATLPFKLAKYGFSSDKSGKAYSIARADGRPVDQLVADFDTRNAWAGTCKVFPPKLTLLDRLVHHQDIRRALGHHRDIPADRLVACLDATPKLGSVFGAKKRTKGLRFVATDVNWSWGDGPEVRGPGEALLLAMLGRRDALKDLAGPGLDTLSAR